VHTGGTNAGKVAVLEEGGAYDKIGVSPEDAELLQSRRDYMRIAGCIHDWLRTDAQWIPAPG
jgi:phage portal protein BeeE